MRRCLCLSVLFLTFSALASTDPTAPRSAEDDVTWSDTFPEGKVRGYFLAGGYLPDERGGIVMKVNSLIARDIALGFESEVELDVAFPKVPGAERGILLTLRAGYDIDFTLVALRILNGKPVLEVREIPVFTRSLDGPGIDPEGPWTLKVHVKHGVVWAKAWPKDKPEPTNWHITHYTGSSGWEPRVVSFLPDTGQTARVTRLAVRGKKPATRLYLDSNEPDATAKKQVVKLAKKVNGLGAKGDLAAALKPARECAEASRKAFGPEHAFTATCVHNLAAALLAMGQYDEALKMAEEAIRLRRKALPTDHPQIALSLEARGAILVALGKIEDGAKQHREVLAFRRRVLGDNHPETAVSWNNLGEALALLAENEEALKCFQESLRVRQSLFGDSHRDVALAHNNLGYQFYMMGEYPEARKQYDAAMKVYRIVHGVRFATHPDTAKLENNLGVLFRSLGQFNEAQEHFAVALKIFTQLGGEKYVLRGRILGNMGLAAAESGDYVVARQFLQEAWEVLKATLGENHHETLTAKMHLALVLDVLGDREAKRLIKEAFDALVRVLPPDHPTVAHALQFAVWLTSDLTKPDEAVRTPLQQALALKQKRLGPTHPLTISSVNALAQYLTLTGESATAERLLSESLAACREKLGDDNPLTLLTRHNLGAVLYARKEYAEAAKHLQQTAERFAKIYGRAHPDTSRSLNILAFALAGQGKRAEALATAAEASSIFATVAGQMLAGSSETNHAAVVEQWRPEIRLYLSLAAVQPDNLGGHGPTLFRAVLDWKATSGRALLNRLEAIMVGQVPGARDAYDKLLVARRMLVQEIMRGPGVEGVEKYKTTLEQLRAAVDQQERDLGKEVKGYASLAQARQAGPAEVAQRLPAGAVLIEFVLLDTFNVPSGALPEGIPSEANYLALVVIPNPDGKEPDVKLVPLGPAKALDETINKWRDLVKTKKRDPKIEEALREKLWDPLAKAIPTGTKRLFIAPAGQLALIPFEAIWHDSAFLVEKYLISYCSTGRDLIPRPAPTTPPGPPVLIADPDFDFIVPKPDAPVTKTLQPGNGRSFAFESNPPEEDRLDGFTTEADAVEKLLSQKFSGLKTLRGRDATEENVQQLQRPRVLYFITHGNFLKDQKTLATLEGRPSTPQGSTQGEAQFLGRIYGEDPRLRSYLCLTGFNQWKKRAQQGDSDGMLTAREVELLDLWGTDLVVTAACKTGVGDVEVGEGVIGLRRAFQQAGARTVVTSLWSVSDDKTAILLPRFLKLYLDGTPKAEALRKAQLEMIAALRESQKDKEKEYQAPPFAWAAFVCHGLPE